MICDRQRIAAKACLLLAASLAGCGGGEDDLPRQAVWGSVTWNNQPLESGSITFSPADPNQPHAASAGGLITNGSYSISRDGGPTPGKYRVAILGGELGSALASDEPPGPPPRVRGARPKPAAQPRPQISEKYNIRSTLMAEVKASESNTFHFDLKSE